MNTKILITLSLILAISYVACNDRVITLGMNYYDVLGVSKEFTPQQIRKSYKQLIMKYHPDKVLGSQEEKDKAEKIFDLVQKAYDTLSDPDQRLIYDEFGGEQIVSREQLDKFYKEKGIEKKPQKDFYSNSDQVISVTTQNFNRLINSKEPILIEFYAPWCVHCQQMVKEYKKAATLLDGNVKVGAVNCEQHEPICRQQMIPAFPNLRYFQNGEMEELTDHAMGDSAIKIQKWVEEVKKSFSQPIYITGAQATKVLQGKKAWILIFSAGDWCQPCKLIQPIVRRLQRQLANMNNLVRVAAINCDEAKQFCASQNIQYYPYVKIFNYGQKVNQQGKNIDLDINVVHHNPHNFKLNFIGEIMTGMFPQGTQQFEEKKIVEKSEDSESTEESQQTEQKSTDL